MSLVDHHMVNVTADGALRSILHLPPRAPFCNHPDPPLVLVIFQSADHFRADFMNDPGQDAFQARDPSDEGSESRPQNKELSTEATRTVERVPYKQWGRGSHITRAHLGRDHWLRTAN